MVACSVEIIVAEGTEEGEDQGLAAEEGEGGEEVVKWIQSTDAPFDHISSETEACSKQL